MSPESPLDATGIARRQFSTVRKGYDPTEVRAFLNELSEVVGRIQREEAHEHERAERAENRAHLAEQLDEHRLVELLGEETARVLEAAREASAGIRSKAEESVARMVREAQAEARAITEQAERDASARQAEMLAEADALRREASDEVERRRVEGQILAEDMRRAAEAERDEMVAAGERARGEADAAAEQIRAAARDQGRRLVGEAHVVRERMLTDLSRRRRVAREQLERLNGARERLLAAYEVVRRTVDDATTELTVSLPEAREASEAAVRRVRDEPEESVEVLEAELSVARMSGVGDASGAEVTDDELDAMLRELAEEEAAQAAARARAQEAAAAVVDHIDDDMDDAEDILFEGSDLAGPYTPDDPPPAPADRVGEGLGSTDDPTVDRPSPAGDEAPDTGGSDPGPASSEGESAAVPSLAAAPAPKPGPAGSGQSDAERWGVRLPRSSRRRASATEPREASDVRAEAARPDPVPSVPTASATEAATDAIGADPTGADRRPQDDEDDGETGPYVDELFARIRAERGRRSAATETSGQTGAVAVLHDAEAADEAAAAVVETTGDPAEAPAADDEPPDPRAAALRTRDELLAAVERELGRRLKRTLADEQNQVLDTLRRGGTVEFADVLPPPDEHGDRYAIAASNDLDLAAVHGAESAGGATGVSCDELSGALGRALVEPLRRRVEQSFHDADGDLDEITERLRALYREWKGQHIGRAVRHYTAAAYSLGAADVVAKGEAQRWLVDTSCEACPDCDDNALAGEIPHGDSYPTGDTRPPAHQDCRCLVVAVSRLD